MKQGEHNYDKVIEARVALSELESALIFIGLSDVKVHIYALNNHISEQSEKWHAVKCKELN